MSAEHGPNPEDRPLLPIEQRWRLAGPGHREWAVLWNSPDGPVLSTPTSRVLAEKEMAEAAVWHDPDGTDPPPPGTLELISREVGPWRSEKSIERTHVGPADA